MSYKYKYKSKKNKKGIIIIICVLILIAIISIFTVKTVNELNYRKTTEYKLITLGYTKDEISFMLSKTNEDYLNSLLDKEYDKMYIDILKEKYFIKDKINDYINYYENNLNSSAKETVTNINVGVNNEYYTNIKQTDVSKDILMINNKYYKLPDNYEPTDLVTVKNWYSYGDDTKLRQEAYDKFIEMYNSAKENDLNIIINSAYRSYKYQEELYNDYLSRYGKEYTDNYAARPGHSEHQTGLTIDVTTYGADGDNFDKTDEFKWLQDNAHLYGYILRYPKGKENITGYKYESWHYRYVGVDVATIIHDENITFDEYYSYYIENVS